MTFTGVDGAYFGTTFPHLFFMTYGSMIPDPPEQKFVPRVFGFRLHRSAVNGAYARGQGASQQHDRDLDKRRQPRVPGSTPGGDGPSGAMTLARASEATALPIRRGSQTIGVAGSGGAPARKKTAVGEAGELGEVEAEDEDEDEDEERARKGAPSKGDETRAAGRSSPQPGEVREKDKNKGKDKDKVKQEIVEGGKGTGGTLRGRGGAENGRTSK